MQLRKAACVLTARHSQHHSAGLPASAARQPLAVVIGTGTDAEPHTAHVDAITTSGTAPAASDVLLERAANLISSPSS